MTFPLPTRSGLCLLLGLAASLSPTQRATAQALPRPTAELLRAHHAAAPTALAARATQPTSPRLDSDLQRLAAQASSLASRGAAPTAATLRASHPHLRIGPGAAGEASVLVRITARDVAALLPGLQRRGFAVAAAYPQLHFVEGLLPVSRLADGTVEALVPSGLLGVLSSIQPESNGGLVTSQADYVLEAARARATRPRQVTGAGVNIGVMSDSFDYLKGAAANVASGDLPVVNVLSDDGSTDEGRAMCQLVYDLAPGSPLAFSTANGGEGVFAQHIRDLADPAKGNCKVIVDDVRYFAEPFFQDGVIAQAITEVVNTRGVNYFSSAGNYADKSYENAAPQFITSAGGRYLNFDVSGATTDVTQRITIANNGTFRPFLQWSDPFYTTNGVKTDLDMFLVSIKNGVTSDTVYRSNARNLVTQYPVESVYFTNNSTTTGTTTFDLVIKLKAGATPTRLKYVNYGGTIPSEWLTASGTSIGHSAAAEGFAVAAVPYYNPKVAESFTSKAGPMTFLFSPTGAPLATPAVRQKPNIASIDGANTTVTNFGSDYEGDGYPNFFGTSAAAPHAAAVAALLRAAEPTLTSAQVYSRLVGSARLIGATATDPLTGPGLVDAFTTLYGGLVPSAPPLIEDLEKGALPVSWNVNAYGAGRAQVSTQAPASGLQSLVLDAYPYITALSLNEATLYLQGVTAGNLVLAFRTRKFVAETDEQMPASFTGRSNTDGVAMSVDGGTTWYRVYDLTGTNSAVTYGRTIVVSLSQIATANGLTLGNDVRLKFQQYGRGGSTHPTLTSRAGRVFDDISIKNDNKPVALYTYSQPSIGCPGLQVQYGDSSLFAPVITANPITSYAWTFPGGTPATSTARTPLVTYNTAGHYGVTLSVTTSAGTSTRADTGIVYIYGRRPAPTVATSAAFICRNSAVTYTSTVAANCDANYTYLWSFPGGSPATANVANPGPVTYATAGTYTATLTVTNSYGGTTVSVPVTVDGRAPVPTLNASATDICRGSAVTFSSTALYCPGTYAWSFPGGSPATSTAANPGAVTYATAGSYTATLTVSNTYGNNTVSVVIDVDGRPTPFLETFDASAAFPRGWTLITPSIYPWIVADGIINRSGTASRVIRAPFARDANVGEKPAVYSPGINLTGLAQPKLRFDLAYAPYAAVAGAVPTDIDSLTIHVVDVCTGNVLGKVYAKGAQGSLATAPSQPTDFFPTAANWRQEIIDLTPFLNKNVIFRFIARNGYGNHLYIDNVNVGNNLLGLTSAATLVGLEAWPNPTPTGTTLHLRLPAFTGRVDLRLVDNLGRVVWQQQVDQTGAPVEHSLSLPFATGLYNLLYTPAGGTPAARRIVLE